VVFYSLFYVKTGDRAAAPSRTRATQQAVYDESMALLRDTLRTLDETEYVGEETATRLRYQRFQIEGARDRVAEVRAFAQRTRAQLARMSRRDVAHKCTLLLVILVLMVADGSLLWLKFIKPMVRHRRKHAS
jgi:hypothetical protein